MRDIQFGVGCGFVGFAVSLATDWPVWKVICVVVALGIAFAILLDWVRATGG